MSAPVTDARGERAAIVAFLRQRAAEFAHLFEPGEATDSVIATTRGLADAVEAGEHVEPTEVQL